jgi:phosphatidylinositol alpha-mannosyltransferase
VRVCLVTPYDLSHDGGVNRHVRSLARALSGLGCQAHVFGPASGEVPDGCRAVSGAIPLPANGSVARIGLLSSGRAIRELLTAGRYDLVHVHEPIVPGPGRYAVGHSAVPVVATFHANAEREPTLQRVVRRFAGHGLSRLAFGIAVSRQAKRFARTIYRGRTAIIPNGVDLDRFAGPEADPRAAGSLAAPRPGPGPGAPLRVLFVGRYGEPRKGFAVLLDAAEELARRGLPARFSVVGDGPAERFAARAARLGIALLGRVDDAELAERYRTSDVFCAPSIGGESFGMVLVEAMAAGCPVVASDLPGYAEAAGGAALLVPPGGPTALADALWRVGQDAALRARLSADGLARAEALSWTHVAARVARVYRIVLSARPALLAAPQPA